MSNLIPIAGLDPSFTHFGVVNATLDLDTLEVTVGRMTTIVTEPTDKASRKVIRKNSDDLKRSQIISAAYPPLVKDCVAVFAEIPTGAQSARAMWAFGASTMAIAFCPVPVIQVQPSETKMAAVGTSTASKEEMIEWAGEKYPNAPWERYARDKIWKSKVIRSAGQICDSEEHVADALAVIEAGLVTDQFRQLLALLRAQIRRACLIATPTKINSQIVSQF
jgi:Holliday junction resolvasome RuvABC endonuclease subunit